MNSKIEIVLVEDNASDAELTIRALKKNNLINNFIHLHDGEEALEYLFAKGRYSHRNIHDLPKVVLLDLKMPKVDGLDVIREIKSNEITKVIPIVLLTSSKENRDLEEGYKLGVNSYIVKPVDFNNFVKAVSETGMYWVLLNQPTK